MNKLLSLTLALALGFGQAQADAVFPTLSTESNEIWYYIQMQRGEAVLTDEGDQANIQTAEPQTAYAEQQLWKVEAGTDGRYVMTNKRGRRLFFSASAGRYQAAATPDGNDNLYIVRTTNPAYDGYEISYNTNEAYSYLNQWGGYGIGRELGGYTAGDPNNPVQFVAEADMQVKDGKPSNVAEVSITGTTTWTPTSKHTLWYKSPATTWMTSTLPIGNGQFGATLMGGVKRDEIQFNDKTLWRGQVGHIVGNGEYGCYLDFGHLYITTTDIQSATNYRRWLDIDKATAGVAYTSDGVDYERQYIASYPDQVVAVRYTASEAGKIGTNIILYNVNGTPASYAIDGNTATATFRGEAKRTGTSNNESYYCEMIVKADGGTITEDAVRGINVDGANELAIYLRGETNFDPSNDDYIYDAALLPGRVQKVVEAAANKGYAAILSDHIADYQALKDRCDLSITDAMPVTPTPSLISSYASNASDNLLLEEMYFAYGRYLMIAASRGVDLPSNLQGIWSNGNSPGWNSDIHSNINVQMNYWPAEPTNLSELHMPFLNYIHREACERSQWSANASQVAGQTKGWTLTTENNIYGSGSNWSSNYTIANAWYCMHLWQHYRYTLDQDYLRNVAFPAMKSCCDYWLERLVLANDGTYECPNEYSPEHGPQRENATAHSQQLVWDLFNNTLQAINILGSDVVDGSFLSDLNDKFAKLDDGLATEEVNGVMLLKEWKYTNQGTVSDYRSHRHLSHLMGLYPGDQITKNSDPQIWQAAINSLNTRGWDGTGWSLAQKINSHARIYDGEGCERLLNRALKLTTYTGTDESRGGIYENLWDAHAPFQIDGNYGTCAGMAEMLLQSKTGTLEILPALPSVWANGTVKGLKAVGNFTVGIAWQDGKAQTVTIESVKGGDVTVEMSNAGIGYDLTDASGNTVDKVVVDENTIRFATTVGGVYTLTGNGKTAYERCDTLQDGDYYISNIAGDRFLSMSTNGGRNVVLSTEKDETCVWVITGANSSDVRPYQRKSLAETEGRVYTIASKQDGLYLRNDLAYSGSASNARFYHPFYTNVLTGAFAIRATDVVNDNDNMNAYYGISGNMVTANSTTPDGCWRLESALTNAITEVGTGKGVASRYYDLQGRAVRQPENGIYIQRSTDNNGKVHTSKVVRRLMK